MTTTQPVRLSAGLAVAFVDALRAEGAIPTSSTIGYVDALTAVGIESESGVYWSGRACLVTRPEDIDTYDAVFERFWFATGAGELTSSLTEEFTLAMDSDDGDDGATASTTTPNLMPRHR